MLRSYTACFNYPIGHGIFKKTSRTDRYGSKGLRAGAMPDTRTGGESIKQSGIELLRFVREEMRHEDNLIVQRTGGLFAVQAFLFSLYFGGGQNITNDDKTILAAIGIIVSIFLLVAILAAINTFLHWKTKLTHLDQGGLVLKRLTLRKHPVTVGWGFLPPILCPLLFVMFWIRIEFFEGSNTVGPRALPLLWGISVSIGIWCLIAALIAACFLESRRG
jgi:hypothetical protein